MFMTFDNVPGVGQTSTMLKLLDLFNVYKFCRLCAFFLYSRYVFCFVLLYELNVPRVLINLFHLFRISLDVTFCALNWF